MFEQERIGEAIEIYQIALKLKPEETTVLENLKVALYFRDNPIQNQYRLGQKHYQHGNYPQAIQHYQNYLNSESGDEVVHANLADCFYQLRRSDESIQTLETAVQIHPESGQLYFALINRLLHQGQTEAAILSAEAAANQMPQDYTFKLLKHLLIPMIYEEPEQIDYYRRRFETGLQTLIQETQLDTPAQKQSCFWATHRYTNFYLAYQAHNVVDSQRNYGNLVHRIMAETYPQWVKPIAMTPAQNRIRIGYVSHYLHSYSGTLWLTGWLKHHNPENFEIYCYYTGNLPDLVTQQFRQYSDVFHHIYQDFEATCQQILADQLHILVYPEIGMDPPTLQRAGLRLAPIQCTAWGHPVTTGLPTIDYFLSSELMEPENAQDHYSETLIRLPNIGVAYPKPRDIPVLRKTRSEFGLPETAVLYFCGQAPFKYLPQYDYIFPKIALRVHQAKFIFLRGELLQERLKKAFRHFNLEPENYCIHLNIPERSDYLMLNLLADVFLDTLTWSGGNTSLEAIACNLPIVTCAGEFMRGRHADSFLKMLDLTETIAQTEAEYLDIAVRLGQDPDWRQAIAQQMSQRQDHLFADPVCVQGLEQFYQEIYWQFCPPSVDH
ncbi:MAG: tetratricopeptide repeat protein [Oscillatoriales cyanobacterium RM1_1_9]|nr:tetratricopeptide repeat protein [Oscillatoriales cyanobacterium SM2_3_0]NJO71369.1 tetratricopeptide repeat protein [Oscillatoriales cyanobacterium RM1_1_9]